MKCALAFGLLALMSCGKVEQSDAIRLEGTPWTVTGELVLKNGAHMPHHEIEFIRIQRGSERNIAGYPFATVKTNDRGEFFFSSYVEGTYAIIAKFDPPCTAHTDLGPLDADVTRSVRLVFDKSKDCQIVL